MKRLNNEDFDQVVILIVQKVYDLIVKVYSFDDWLGYVPLV